MKNLLLIFAVFMSVNANAMQLNKEQIAILSVNLCVLIGKTNDPSAPTNRWWRTCVGAYAHVEEEAVKNCASSGVLREVCRTKHFNSLNEEMPEACMVGVRILVQSKLKEVKEIGLSRLCKDVIESANNRRQL